jgi:hypothetical protein
MDSFYYCCMVKVKAVTLRSSKQYKGVLKYNSTPLNSALDQHQAQADLLLEEYLGTNKRGYMGPRDGLNDLEKRKLFPLQGFEPGILQPVT